MASEQIVVDESNIPAGVVGCDDTVPKSKSVTFSVILMFQCTKTNIVILAEKCSAKFMIFFYILLTMHLIIFILVINQLYAQNFVLQ